MRKPIFFRCTQHIFNRQKHFHSYNTLTLYIHEITKQSNIIIKTYLLDVAITLHEEVLRSHNFNNNEK